MKTTHNLLRAAATNPGSKSAQSMFKKAGLTLLESMIALAIFAVVIWAAMANYSTANATQSASQMATELQSLRASVKDLYSGQGNFGTDSLNETMIAANKVPSTLTISGDPAVVLTASTGANVEIEGDSASFTITYTGVPKAQCISAITGAGGNGWLDITVGEGAAAASYTPATASGVCTNDTANDIVFRGA